MKPYFDRAAFYLTCGSLVSILFSIAVSQILLGLALAALLLSAQPMRLPPIKLPLVLFMACTILSLLFSGHMSEGTPQIRKFLVFAILLLVYSTFRTVTEVRGVVLAWAGVANTYFWIDPKKQVAGVIMMQFLPFADREAIAVLGDFEHAVYASA